ANCHGPAKFITPGSLNVQIEGKNVHQLSDMVLNNCGPGGSPPNTGATMCGGVVQATAPISVPCTCSPTRRDPPENAPRRPPQEQVNDLKATADASQARVDALVLERQTASPVRILEIDKALPGARGNAEGDKFVHRVAKEEHEKGRLKETNVL